MARLSLRTAAFAASVAVVLPVAAAAQGKAAGASSLRVVNAGPTGEIAQLAEANEVRIVFSEPMVALGRVPARVQAPFFHVSPAIAGAFRWSGTTILIFTPEARRKLPFATRYEVTIDATARAVSGRRLARLYKFAFTTPTVKLLSTAWYRRRGTVDSPMVILLRFNQPVRTADVLPHLGARLDKHAWKPPVMPGGVEQRLAAIDPQAMAKFNAKVTATHAVVSSDAPVSFRPTTGWDKKRYRPGADLIALETTAPVLPESHVKLIVDGTVPSPAGTQTPGAEQSYTIEAEPAFFIEGFHCPRQCDPDAWNPIEMRSSVKVTEFVKAVKAVDVTTRAAERAVPKAAKPKPREGYQQDGGSRLTLEDAGFDAQPPARTYAVAVSGDLKSVDGQTLGYPWMSLVENWHQRPFTSFGDGHGVWESSGGAQLPFYARNYHNIMQWAFPVQPANLMPTLVDLESQHFHAVPPADGTARRLGVTPDRVQSHGLDVSKALSNGRTGLVWAAVREGDPIPNAKPYVESRVRASVVQVTNLGISVKDSPQNTLVFVTRLDNGAPVAGANVSIVRVDNQVFWKGTTGSDGVAIAPSTPLRDTEDWSKFTFVVMAEKDGDVAYVGNDWTEGITPWEFGVRFNLNEASPLLRGSVFSDRGVYRLGEEVHLKAILRHNTPTGVRLLRPGTAIAISLRDSQDRVIDDRTVKVNAWSSAEWTVTLPADGALGNYSVRATLETDRPKPKTPEQLRPDEEPGPGTDDSVEYNKAVHGAFLVAAYRRPDFRVDVTLTSGDALTGTPLKGAVTARYLFGAPMGARPAKWTLSRSPVTTAPAAVCDRFTGDRWLFVGWAEGYSSSVVASEEEPLAKTGELPVSVDTPLDAGIPYMYTLEGDVEDVSRQHIANRATFTVHPAPWYIGILRPSYFVEQKNGIKTQIVAVTPEGVATPGVPVEVTLTQIQWNSVRRAEGNGFYTWETERKEVPVGTWTVTTGAEPAPLDINIPGGGYFVLKATGREPGGRFAVTQTSFYALGEGYTAWMRYDHNRIDLVPERKTYKPGDTARIMIQSPWERATALVTTEREGVRSHRQFALTSTQQSIAEPIAEADIPNVFVSVMLVKGRTATPDAAKGPSTSTPLDDKSDSNDASDPGKPSFRLGYVELKVEDASKRLTVAVTANKQEYRPANAAKVTLDVKDRQGRGSASEVTLWAVDYGVLSLTNYQTPDVLGSVYVEKALQVMNTDNRQRIVSRRVLTPKGDTDGGGGGAEPGAGTLRKDFRVLAFWLGSVTTDGKGHASVDVKLPESLTTYRIMAVAGDRDSRFGKGDSEVRVNKPVTMKATFPRFLAVGDKASFGAVVTSQLKSAGEATVTIKSLDPGVLMFSGDGRQTIQVPSGGSIEARFDAAGRAVGRARVQMSVKLNDESDAFEDVIPVEILASPEVVAAYGEAADANNTATETLTIPKGVVPGYGGLHVELASTAMVGLGEGARYLVEYPYGCAEQRGSRALAMLLAADLGDAFSLPGMDTSKMRPAVQQALKDLEKYQCPSGGFAYWPGACWSDSPYLTAYLLHVFKVAVELKYDVSKDMQERAYTYLERELAEPPPTNESWWPSYTAWQAFAVKVLAEGGRNQDSNVNRLYGYRERMPVFALAYLYDALAAKDETSGARVDELRRRMANAILPEAGSAHIEELSDPYLLWFWNSNVRSTAIVLNTLVKDGAGDAPIRQLVRWMMAARKDGRWGNTQENAMAMESLVSYYRKYEGVVPDFRAVVKLGTEDLAREQFKGRSTEASSKDLPMSQVLARAEPGASRPLTFTREGAGTLFYVARLRYAADELYQQGLDAGMRIERTYAPYVEKGRSAPSLAYKAGDLVRVTLTFNLTKERRFVAVTDPLPAGFEPVESWFATTAASLAQAQDSQGAENHGWFDWWQGGGFDHVERHDDRVLLFATRLSEGRHTFSYVARATTAGTYRTAPARAEEMYEPEIFGRTATAVIEVKK